jgi:DNA-binding HxlR family transcriptional regulator
LDLGEETDSLSGQRSGRDLLRERFREFSESASRFSRGIEPIPSRTGLAETADLNLRIARTVFGKWSLEILVLLYTMKRLGFEEARRSLGKISSRVLSEKLKQLEGEGLVLRGVVSSSPPRVSYALTEKGLIVARLGEPVFLFLRQEQPPQRKPSPGRPGSHTSSKKFDHPV